MVPKDGAKHNSNLFFLFSWEYYKALFLCAVHIHDLSERMQFIPLTSKVVNYNAEPAQILNLK